jgi:hypothetical protein
MVCHVGHHFEDYEVVLEEDCRGLCGGVGVMPEIHVLYLPRDERLRTIVRMSLDFLGEVYRDEVLSCLRFVSFDPDDGYDVKNVLRIAELEGFAEVVERRGLRLKVEPRQPLFFMHHYDPRYRYVWIPVSSRWSATAIFRHVAHEVSHDPIFYVPTEDKHTLASAFDKDLGLDEMVRRYGSTVGLAVELIMILQEAIVMYIIDNYFQNLNREPVMPTTQTEIRDFALQRYYGLTRQPGRPRTEVGFLSELLQKMARKDLSEFRRAVHRVFTKLAKKLPVDVLGSNRIKYEVLYRFTQYYQ